MILNCHQYIYSHETYRDKQEEENKRPTQKRTWEMIKQTMELIKQLYSFDIICILLNVLQGFKIIFFKSPKILMTDKNIKIFNIFLMTTDYNTYIFF